MKARGAIRQRGRGRGGKRSQPSSDDESRKNQKKGSAVTQQLNAVRGAARGLAVPRQARQQPLRDSKRPRGSSAAAKNTFSNNTKLVQSNFTSQVPFQQRYVELKSKREAERTDAIAKGFLADPDRPRTLAEAITPVGTCGDMCPEFERVERVVQNDVWTQEADTSNIGDGSKPLKPVPDERRMVKKFRRAAAGLDEQLPSDLRPPQVLKRTLDYLFDGVIGQSDTLANVHHFVWDRTRAVRNDFSIQQLTKSLDLRIAVECYERIARFHILSLHILATPDKPYEQYDAQQEREQLDKTLLSLMQYYDDSKDRIKHPNEVEFRAYCIIFQIQDPTPDLESRVQSWPVHIAQSKRVQTALKVYAAACNTFDPQGPLKPRTPHPIAQANWRRFWMLVESRELSYLMCCIAETYFPLVRRTALQSLWHAYRQSGNRQSLDWSIEDLVPVLGFDNAEQVNDYLERHGFTIVEREDGEAYVDLNSVAGRALPDPSTPQLSSSIAEEKRHGRTLPAIISGLSIRQARKVNMIDDAYDASGAANAPEVQITEDEDESLFVTEDSEAEQSHSLVTSDTEPGASKSLFQPNPFAQPFLPKTPTKSSTAAEAFKGISQPPQQVPTSSMQNPSAGTSPFSSFFPTSKPQASPTQNQTWKPENPVQFSGFKAPKTFNPQTTSNLFPTTQAPIAQGQNNDSGIFSPFSSHDAQIEEKTSQSEENASVGNKLFTSAEPFANPFAPSPSPAADARTPKPTSLFNPFNTSTGNNGTSSPSKTNPNSSPPIPNQPKQRSRLSQVENSSDLTEPPKSSFQTPTALGHNPAASSVGFPSSFLSPQQPQMPSFNNTASLFAPKLNDSSTSSLFKSVGKPDKTPSSHIQEAPKSWKTADNDSLHLQAVKDTAAEDSKKVDETLENLARQMIHRKGGFLEQFVEFTAAPMTKKIVEDIRKARLDASADTFRHDTLMLRYGKKWREICLNRRLARQGRERRRRAQHAARDRTSVDLTSAASSPVPETRPSSAVAPYSGFGEPNSTPTKSRPFHASKASLLPTTTHGVGSQRQPRLESSMMHRAAQFGASNSSSGILRGSGNADRSYSQYSRPGSRVGESSRSDTTRSTYFKLKAMGYEPNSATLFPDATRVDDGPLQSPPRKRSREESEVDGYEFTPRKRSQTASDTRSPVEFNEDHRTPLVTKSSVDEDEELFAALRETRRAMTESIDFFRDEVQKDEMRRSRPSSRASSIANASAILEENRQFKKPEPPPKYRNRVSKFLPREKYADMLIAKHRAVQTTQNEPAGSLGESLTAPTANRDHSIDITISNLNSIPNLDPSSLEDRRGFFSNNVAQEANSFMPLNNSQTSIPSRQRSSINAPISPPRRNERPTKSPHSSFSNPFAALVDDSDNLQDSDADTDSEDGDESMGDNSYISQVDPPAQASLEGSEVGSEMDSDESQTENAEVSHELSNKSQTSNFTWHGTAGTSADNAIEL